MIAIENARLLDELHDSLDRQTANAEILRVIASTPGDPTHALDTIAATAARLFGAGSVSVLRVEGGMLRPVSLAGPTSTAVHNAVPDMPLDPAYRAARSVLEKRQIHGDNVISHATESARRSGQELPVTSIAFTPLMRQGEAIGTMVVVGAEVRLYTEIELEMMRSFADQAVIAIENARLLDELEDWNKTLEARVTEQVSELGRMGELRRFLSPQIADLVSSGSAALLESHRREITVVYGDMSRVRIICITDLNYPCRITQ